MREAPTIYQVAQAAGVSIATVSRALSDASKLRPETRERVLRTVAELGYVPSGPARGMATRRTGVLGLALPDLADPSVDEGHETLLDHARVLHGVERAARRAGYAVLIATGDRGEGDEARGPDLAGDRGDGGGARGPDPVGDGARGLDLSIAGRTDGLVLCTGPRGPERLDRVAIAGAAGMAAVTRHLIQVHGHVGIVFLGGPAGSPEAADRFEGYRQALAEAGLRPPREPTLTGDLTQAGGAAAMAAHLAAGHRPWAVVCANDQMAVGALEALAGVGLRVPADVAVVGFGDEQRFRHVRPPLTTVRPPMRQLGTAAVELLLRRLAEPEARPGVVTLPAPLVVRASCGCS